MSEEDVLEKPTADNIPDEADEKLPAESDESAADDAEKEPVAEEVKEDDQPKKNHDQRRWERLLNERAEYKAKLELYERQQQAQQAQTKSDSGRPARENFASDEDYVDALTDWKLEQKWEPMQQRFAEQQRAQQVDAAWDAKLQQAKAEYSDFDAVLQDSQDVPITPVMAQAIKSSDVGADLAYFLGKDPEYAVKISRMDPISAARELGRIESYIEYDKSQRKPAVKAAVSKAPSPIKPVKTATTSSGKSLEDMSPAEYVAYRNKQDMERRKRR